MDADKRLAKALSAAQDALQHLSLSPSFSSIDCTHIDRLVSRIVDLPTEGAQRNSRRNLLVIRQWMVTEGPGVVLLEVLGQLYWRLGELNSKQFEKFKEELQESQPYLSLVRDEGAVELVLKRLQHVQRVKAEACEEFLCELVDLTGLRVDSPMSPDTSRSSSRSGSPFSTTSTHSSLSSYSSSSATLSHPHLPPSLLLTAHSTPSTHSAALALSAAHLSSTHPAHSTHYTALSLSHSTTALRLLASQLSSAHYTGAVETSMLLMRHASLTTPRDAPGPCWSVHAGIFDALPSSAVDWTCESAGVMRGMLVLSRTAFPASELRRAGIWSVEIFPPDAGNADAEGRICSLLGASQELVRIVSLTTALACSTGDSSDDDATIAQAQAQAQGYEQSLRALRQWSSEPPGPARERLLLVAEAHRLAALLYLRCRIYGETSSPFLAQLTSSLAAALDSLARGGAGVEMPAWPVFVMLIVLPEGRRGEVVGKFGGVGRGGLVGRVVEWVRGVGEVNQGEGWDGVVERGTGWGGGMLCLG